MGSVGTGLGSPTVALSAASIGKDASVLVKRHDKQGKTHGEEGLNTHLTVGDITLPSGALKQVYGDELCEPALMSFRRGNGRFYCCDKAGQEGHESLSSVAHQLPTNSGPNHKRSWDKVLAAAGVKRVKKVAEEAEEQPVKKKKKKVKKP